MILSWVISESDLFQMSVHMIIDFTIVGHSVLYHSPLVARKQDNVNSSPPGQNVRHFADDIFSCILMNEKFCILIKISLQFVSKGPLDNYPIRLSTAWQDDPPPELLEGDRLPQNEVWLPLS